MNQRCFIAPNEVGPTEAIAVDADRCIGCNACVNICRTQTILKNPVSGQPPLLVYPDECWFCGCCVEACPTGALQMRQPIGRRILFKRKTTGELFRIGQKNPPVKSYFYPPQGEIREPRVQEIFTLLNRHESTVIAVLDENVCKTAGDYFGWAVPESALVFLLKNIGFDYVLKADERTALIRESSLSGRTFVFFTDGSLSVSSPFIPRNGHDLCSLIHRACVSMYTAVHIGDAIPLMPFDSITDL